MKTDTLMQDLTKRIESYADLPWVNGYTGSFRPEGSPEGNIELKEIGNWLSIVAVFRWDGTTMDQTTDRSSGDPYSCVVRYSWIGPKESAPNKVSTPEELDTWASVSLKYASENTISDWYVSWHRWQSETSIPTD